MWELDCEESWVLKNWCFWTVVLGKTLESPLDFKEIQPVHPKGDESWVFIGRTDAEAETPILWPPHVKSWLIGKDPDVGRGWGQEEKGMSEDEMAGWHHQLDGHEFEWTLVVGDGQGGLACCNSWGLKESDTTERLNWTYPTNFRFCKVSVVIGNTFTKGHTNISIKFKPMTPIWASWVLHARRSEKCQLKGMGPKMLKMGDYYLKIQNQVLQQEVHFMSWIWFL